MLDILVSFQIIDHDVINNVCMEWNIKFLCKLLKRFFPSFSITSKSHQMLETTSQHELRKILYSWCNKKMNGKKLTASNIDDDDFDDDDEK